MDIQFNVSDTTYPSVSVYSEYLHPSCSSKKNSSTSYCPVVNQEQAVSASDLITNFNDEVEEMIVPDEWPHREIHETSTIHFIPKIKIKSLKDLQDPQMHSKIEQDEPEKYQTTNINGNITQNKNRLAMMNVTQGIDIGKECTALTNSAFQSENYNSEDSTEAVYRAVKLQKKEHILKKRLLKLQEKQHILCSFSGDKKKSKSWLVHRKISGDSFDSPENNGNHHSTLSRNRLQSTKPLCFDPNSNIFNSITHEETKENKLECNENLNTIAAATVEKVDVTVLKQGIINASRTLINTEKSLKNLSQLICGHITLKKQHVSLKNQETINIVSKFQKMIDSFCKRIDDIDKTIENQYNHLVKDKYGQPFREPIHTPAEDKYKKMKLKTEDVVNNERKSCTDEFERDELKNKSNSIKLPRIRVVQSKWKSNKKRKQSRTNRPQPVVEDIIYTLPYSQPISQRKPSKPIMVSIAET